jgi:molybdopterin synthase sulfur carrier subunit
MTIHIQIKLFATLLDKLPENTDNFPVKDGITVASLADLLGIDPKDAKLIFINGRKGELDSILQEGDRVGLFPPVGGG